MRRAVEQLPDDRRVAVAGAGGLSTGIVQEDLDQRIIAALQNHDLEAIAELPAAGIQGPCGEIYNWVSVAGATEHLTMELLDYLPVYRSPAATGCGLAYACWR